MRSSVERSITAEDVVESVAHLCSVHGEPEVHRSDNGPEFVAKVVKEWLERSCVKDTLHRAGEPMGERIRRVVQQLLS
jgi:hypothetical protein